MKRLALGLAVLTGCATAQLRPVSAEVAAREGLPEIAGQTLRWGMTEADLEARFPGTNFVREQNWVSAALEAGGQPAITHFRLEDGRLVQVTASFDVSGAVRPAYETIQPGLRSEFGEPNEVRDARSEAVSTVRQAAATAALVDLFVDVGFALAGGHVCAGDVAGSAEIAAELNANQTPEQLESIWNGPEGQIRLSATEAPAPSVELTFLPVGAVAVR